MRAKESEGMPQEVADKVLDTLSVKEVKENRGMNIAEFIKEHQKDMYLFEDVYRPHYSGERSQDYGI